MSTEIGFDTSRLRLLQEDVRRLNESALASGLLDTRKRTKAKAPDAADPAATDPTATDPTAAAPPAPPIAPVRKKGLGRRAARRLVALTARIEGDDSPDVHGTGFTEAGVVRLLARLRRGRKGRRGAWSRFLARAYRGLTRPVPMGQHTIAGISLARLQVFSGQLAQVESKGLAHLEARRAARRGRMSQTGTLMLGGSGSAPAPIEGNASS